MKEKPKSITDKKTLKLMVIVDPYLYDNIKVGGYTKFFILSLYMHC